MAMAMLARSLVSVQAAAAPALARTISTTVVAGAGYKLKNHSGASKRFKVKKAGIMKQGAGRSHLLVGKSRRRLSALGDSVWVSSADVPRFDKLLPNTLVRRRATPH
eukprot:c874_g1_i1.p1 GENE.c874_g1_i1~~c874_g1_i1.p1  ORF type:complete len:107 (+),score=6.35 c874_g1_i1:122-442(+)